MVTPLLTNRKKGKTIMEKYNDLALVHENRLPQRAYYIPHLTLESALTGDRYASKAYKSLNGTWNFAFFLRDIDVPETITDWATIPVPSCWQLQGWENPNYTNINYPYPVDIPYVPVDNPCGVYQREFEFPVV